MSRRCTQTEALRRIQALSPADAGRLVAVTVRGHAAAPIPTGTLHPEAAARLRADLYPPPGRRPASEQTAGDLIVYVVSVDATPVAWLTAHARVVTPPADLTTYQLAQQARVVIALRQPTRHAIAELARLRDHREGRSPGLDPDPLDQRGQALVADPRDPTRTWWTRINADPEQTMTHLRTLTGAAGQALVVDSYGYGAYGRRRGILDPVVLCTLERLAAEHDLPLDIVGDWLSAEGAATVDPTPDEITAAFAQAYAGVYATRRTFATAEADRRGWSAALQAADIPAVLFDLDRFITDLFTDEVHGLRLRDDRLAVFRRH
jgi:hypothetical protein